MIDFDNLPRLDELPETELPELTETEVDDLLEHAAAINEFIRSKQQILDNFTAHYQMKIERAQEIYEQETDYARRELATITDRLERWATKHITGKKRSFNLPSGKLAFRRQQPLFLVDGESVTNDNPALIDIARRVDSALIKTREFADWAELKKRLAIDDNGNVYLRDTGEVIADLHAELQPDKFTMEPTQ